MNGRTGRLPGTQTKAIRELDAAISLYVDARDARMKKSTPEKEAKTKLIELMKKHKVEVYKDQESGRIVTLKHGDDSIKVTDVETEE